MTDSETGLSGSSRTFRLSDIRPTTRRRLSRGASYGVALIVVLLVVFLTDWDKIQRNFFNADVASDLVPAIFRALGNTLLYTLVCFVLGTLLAVVFALMKMAHGPARWFAVAYIELFRGLPALLTIFAFAFMIPIAFRVRLPGGTLGGGLIALVIVTSAYNAEVIRSGIEAVPKGQREAARSLGMPHLTTMLHVILPQGLRIVIPPLTNEFVMLLKDTALLFIAGLTAAERELTTFGRDGMTTHGNSTPLILAAVLYLIVTVPLTALVGKLEKKLAVKK
ncbi:MAG: amino acid ABC transporter permease [Propionibacteriaceae bacterium]|jgi:polar amino acid transport system permease protein|nr:amino acid ABC transporter permease [Propionibacteriaceae bacterium]